MAHNKYIRHDFDSCLAHFVEECGEVMAAAGKILRFALYSVNPEIPEADRETNARWLRRELADLHGAVTRLQKCFDEDRMP